MKVEGFFFVEENDPSKKIDENEGKEKERKSIYV